MAVIHINKENFEQIKNGDQVVLIDFYADWCGPCRMVAPVVEEIAKENANVVVGKINVDDDPEIAQAFDIVSIPTLVVMKDGKVVNTAVGVRTKDQILAMLNI